MIVFHLMDPLQYLSAFHHRFIFKGFIKNNHKVISEVFRHSPAVTCSITDDGFFFRKNLHGRTLVESIHQHIRTGCFRESKAKDSRAFRWRNFGCHIVISQVNTVVIRFGYFSLV
ncbi:hypothetical protein SDC9_127771 [bioreactor metagenome]|uniref:Uncharacterized protein n=1 Tax=bioreactor metagenome TaxID=1076179 RepID=A0A645CUZ4_9ZZZZ